MQKLSNFTGQARHGWEKMTPAAFGMGRPHLENGNGNGTAPAIKRPVPTPSVASTATAPYTEDEAMVNLSFNIPFASSLHGPPPEDVVHATPGALARWTHPEGTSEDAPVHELPVHRQNVDGLRALCESLREVCPGRLEYTVTTSEPKALDGQSIANSTRQTSKGYITNLCVSGEATLVQTMRSKIFSETPLALQCAVVNIESTFVIDPATGFRQGVLDHLDKIAAFTGCDIFLLSPKAEDPDTSNTNYVNGTVQSLDQRLRVAIYGDPESSEHAKMRVLIMIDQILKRKVDMLKLELSLHSILCGKTRKHIRAIEAESECAIYFPPPFPRVYGYVPPLAAQRGENEIYITGEDQEHINFAKRLLHEMVVKVKCYVKDVAVSPPKVDAILLERLDKVKKVMDQNGTYVVFPPLGSLKGKIRVQGTEINHVERTVKEIMALAGQFYSASWWILKPDPSQADSKPPSPADIRSMLSDVCTTSGADVSFEKFSFTIDGSDDAVKAAMVVIQQIPFIVRAQYQIRVKIELANEHKEFVSGKKNGKINKIMGQSHVQIIFDGFNDYNFYIDVCGSNYNSTKNGLDLLEQEMPASIAFHVPDQYHKRIIGIGGQHIQRIMKKYSVFVKFSNALERGNPLKVEDDLKIDNVICRTPARNAQSLDLVKQEIMDMVEKVDAEFVSETVIINRLYHRELIGRTKELEALEKKWNCKIEFPTTEMASDVVTISGPEYQVPKALDGFLGMVPESHELVLPGTPSLRAYFQSAEFKIDVCSRLKSQYEIDLVVLDDAQSIEDTDNMTEERLVLSYTRNNAGGLKDAIDFLISKLVPHGLDAATVKGALSRPKSDSFQTSLPFFNSALLQRVPVPTLSTDSPTRSTFTADDVSERGSIFDKLRKPGSISSISSFLDRRKNHSSSSNSLFKHASSNASKASLISMESRDSGYRSIWNDSTANLPEEDHLSLHTNGWPSRYDSKLGLASTSVPGFPFTTMLPGDSTPKHESKSSADSGRPLTSHSSRGFKGYPVPIGTPLGPPTPSGV